MSAVSPPAMYERGCAICGVKAHQSWMKAEVDFAALDGFAFASRKLPEYMHFDLALCPECDLVFANAVPDTAWFQSSYRDAQFDAENESKYAAQTYANEIKNYYRYSVTGNLHWISARVTVLLWPRYLTPDLLTSSAFSLL